MSDAETLPPGNDGLPLLGETLAFLSDMFGFMRKRTAEHGPVFRSNILGKPTIFISGADITDKWLDEELVERAGSFPKPVAEIFGGTSLPLLDGPAHKTRKALVMSAFGLDMLPSYLPKLDSVVADAFARWTRTYAERDVVWLDELKRVAIEGIAATILGVTEGPDLASLLDDYKAVTRGFAGLPIPLPGTAYSGALAAKDRLLALFRKHIAARKEAPADDGLSRLLAARSEAADVLAAKDMALELHHVFIAGLIIFAELAAAIVALTKDTAIRDRLRAEIAEKAPGRGAVTIADLKRMPYLLRVVMETKRHCPNVPVSFGRVRKTFSHGGYSFPKGHFLFMAVGEQNMQSIFTQPERFDPERFAAPRSEHERHPHAFQPQGAGTEHGHHKCAGAELSTVFMQVFLVRLVRDHDWTLLDRYEELRWDVVPPEPKHGLKARVKSRA